MRVGVDVCTKATSSGKVITRRAADWRANKYTSTALRQRKKGVLKFECAVRYNCAHRCS